MRWPVLLVLVACGSQHQGVKKAPNEELIVGEYERHPPDGTTVINFKPDGSLELAHDRASLGTKNLATGTFELQGSDMTLTYTGGEMCNGQGAGHYQVVISRIGIRFTKVDDPCDQRAKMDGQTWFRVK